MDRSVPQIPANCDLRGLEWFPLFRRRLLDSTFHHIASAEEWRAGVILWMKSWDQTPAGSLPADDRELSALAELGRDRKLWDKVKAVALHGWEPAGDGRLYHPTVTEVTLDAWNRTEANRQRTRAATQARRNGQRYVDRDDQRYGHHPNPNPFFNNNIIRDSYPAREGSPVPPPWAARLDSWAKGRRWNPIDGPAPDEPGCLAPPELIADALRKRNANGAAT